VSIGDTLVPAERHQHILRLALGERIIRIKDLARTLGVHEMTIRRDLDTLAEEGLLQRVHGGARLVQQAGAEVAYTLRSAQQVDAKARIAHAALTLVGEGDVVGLDASTTALTLAQLLSGVPVQAVVTGLDVANALAAAKVPFTLIGGTFHERARSFVGSMVTQNLARLHLDTVFFSAKGLSVKAGFTDAHLPEVEVKERLIATGGKVVALMDSSKLGLEAFSQIVPLEQIDVLITDADPSAELKEALGAADIRLIVAEENV
jgi:DeoR family fructose operon transcriptional repressor